MNHSMSNDHMNADRFQAFLEDELPPRDLVRVEEHLADCARCSAELDVWRMLFDDLGALPSYRPREGFADRVMTDVRVPEPLPLVARVRTRWAAPKRVTEHVGDGVLPAFVTRTIGVPATMLARGSGPRRSGINTASTCLLSLVHRTDVTSVAFTARLVRRRNLPFSVTAT